MKLRKISLIASSVVLTSMLLSIVSLWGVYRMNSTVISTQENRQKAMNTVSDFRIQMIQLNKLIKGYIATADPKYLIYYYDLLAIQEGVKGHPDNYKTSVYWDMVIAEKVTHVMRDKTLALSITEQMKRQDFSEQELKTLQEIFSLTAKTKQIEQIAFAATQGLYDAKGQTFIEDGKPDLEFASKLIYSLHYQLLNAELNEAIEKLVSQTDRRTQSMVNGSVLELERWVLLALCFAILTVLVTLTSFLKVERLLLIPIEKLTHAAQTITDSDYSFRINAATWLEELKQLGLTFNRMANDIFEDIANREKNRLELEEAKKIAEEATKAKSMFLANISHELRTPLNSIIGMAYLALQSKLSPKQREYIDHVDFAAKSLLGIINDLLDFSKIEAGKITIEAIPFNLQELLHHIVTLHRYQADEKGIKLIYKERDIAAISQTHWVISDPLRIGQIINNLLSNAIKFTHQGSVKLSTHAYMQNDTQLFVRMVVEDTGIGINLEQQSKLFQEFVQADSSITRKFGGTGLGLAISKHLAEIMGGTLSIVSKDGSGSMFELELMTDTRYRDAKIDETQTVPMHNHPDLRNMRALLVEDNEMNQKLVVELLKMKEIEVTIAENGQEALQILSNRESTYFDLILMDLQMPVMDGFEATKEIRKNPLYADIPVIAMTAHTVESEIQVCKEIGMREYLGKPIDPENLFAIMSKYAPRHEAMEQSKADAAMAYPSVDLAGINLEKGLKNTNNNLQLYLGLLNDFSVHYEHTCQELEACLHKNDFESGEKLSHTLKGGLLGTIGAETLYQRVIGIEDKFKNKTVTVEELSCFRIDFETLIINIKKYRDSLDRGNNR